MIAGLPLEAWLLLILSICMPLAIELKFFFTHYKRKNKSDNGAKP
jgi:hypothetical protein